MNKIRKLPTETVSKIAAGEVVERPMNIVKELVENALDANADQIHVTIEDGGKKSVKIVDNGEGIPVDDLEMAFQLHTTSKLEDDDPSVVSTLGFRGEALASIAAVSHIEVYSKTEDDDNAKKMVLEGGKVLEAKEYSASTGTMIQVTGIFFNTPARRKFLKTAATERKRITDLMTNYALMYPEVHFKLEEKLKSGNMTNRMESPSRKSMMAVIYDVLGAEYAKDLIAMDTTIGEWDIVGYISKPSLTRSDRAFQFVNVNGRPIRNKNLQTAIEDAYGSQLMRRTHPVLVLKMEGPVDAVDFNIHPQKSEIRFKEGDKLFTELPTIILETLSEEVELPSIQKNKLKRIRQKKSRSQKKDTSTSTPSNSDSNSTSSLPTKESPSQTKSGEEGSNLNIPQSSPRTYQTSLDKEKITETTGNFDVLGHIMNKFGLVFAEDELWLVDVHAADERVKFEMYADGKEREVSSQTLLQALSVKIPSSDKQLLLDNKSELENFGLRISNGGPTTLLVHSIPVYYDQKITPRSIQELLQDIVSHLNDEETEKGPSKTPLEAMEYAIISRLACHGAIRSGYPVSRDRIKQVLQELLNCEYPWTCAHGRPTVLRMPKSRIESFFKR